MWNSRQNKLDTVRIAIMENQPLYTLSADSLTLGEAYSVMRLEQSVNDAKQRASRAIDKMIHETEFRTVGLHEGMSFVNSVNK
jgi:hypothetical protein